MKLVRIFISGTSQGLLQAKPRLLLDPLKCFASLACRRQRSCSGGCALPIENTIVQKQSLTFSSKASKVRNQGTT